MQTPEYMREYYIKNRKQLIQRQKKIVRDIRNKLFTILNPEMRCVKCGFSDIRALQIDHINGWGTQEYKGNKKNAMKMYRIYLKNPELAKKKVQILCANCNWIKKHENKEHSHRSA